MDSQFKKYIVLTCLLLLPLLAANSNESHSENNNAELKSLTLPKIKITPIKDTQSNKQYELYVKLPDSYTKNTDKKYPVIYYTDALWHVELLSPAVEYIIEDAILVGISWQTDINNNRQKKVSEHFSRYGDYTILASDKADIQAKYQLGQADKHLAFIRNDVIPNIEKSYRTDPNNRSYFGYSLGGLFGAYVLLSEPATFKNYIISSPALNGDMPMLTKLSAASASKNPNIKANVLVSNGSLEKEAANDIKQFINLLNNSKNDQLTVKHIIIEGGHQSAFPMTGVQGITWLSNLKN